MATRRGGRGRRRGPGPGQRTYRTRAATAAEPSLSVEERRDEEAYEQEEPAPLPPRPALARSVDRFARPVITDLLREGQEIIVQIAKEPIGQKGARITSHIALPGRYIVYMPTVDHIGVSRKIGTDEERQRLKRTLHQLRAESGAPGGFIVRTAANGCTIEELREDMQYLIRTWTDIRRRADRVKAPAHRSSRSRPGAANPARSALVRFHRHPRGQRIRVRAHSRFRQSLRAQAGQPRQALHQGHADPRSSTASRPRSTRPSSRASG